MQRVSLLYTTARRGVVSCEGTRIRGRGVPRAIVHNLKLENNSERTGKSRPQIASCRVRGNMALGLCKLIGVGYARLTRC